MNQDTQELRQRYIENPPDGMTPDEACPAGISSP